MNKYLKSGITFFQICVLILIQNVGILSAQSRVRSVPFSHEPTVNPDNFTPRISQHTLAINKDQFITLKRIKEQEYVLECYTSDLRKVWQTPVALAKGEELEAFSSNAQQAIALTYQKVDGNGNQALSGYLIDLKTGKKTDAVKLVEAPTANRRISVALSEDGSKLVACQYVNQLDQLKSINARVYDGNLTKIKDRLYDFRDLQGIASATIRIDNKGSQYVALLVNKATKLTVRRYENNSNEIKGMDVQVGGVFDGKPVYVLESKFQLQQDGNLYAAVICADEKSGDYHSVKLVRFDFTAGDMKYAPEFRFTPQYIAAFNKAPGANQHPVKRLEDIYLSDILVSSENRVVLLAEKKYNEGPKLPFAAKEIHYFAYDEYLNPAWNAIIHKNQTAPASDGYAGISYKATLLQDAIHVLTLETQNGKTDLFNRKINIKTGTTETPKPLGLNLVSNQGMTYLKDFTIWLDNKNIITVAKPAKKTSLQLNKITLK